MRDLSFPLAPTGDPEYPQKRRGNKLVEQQTQGGVKRTRQTDKKGKRVQTSTVGVGGRSAIQSKTRKSKDLSKSKTKKKTVTVGKGAMPSMMTKSKTNKYGVTESKTKQVSAKRAGKFVERTKKKQDKMTSKGGSRVVQRDYGNNPKRMI